MMKPNYKKSFSLLFTIGLAMGVIFCKPESGCTEEVRGVTNDAIRLGLILDQTGPAASATAPITQGLKCYVRYINDQGGIHDRKIDFKIEDDRYSIPMAISAFKKLVYKDEVLALMGPTSSGGLTALWKRIEKEKVPLMSAIMPEFAVKPFKRYIFTFADIYPNQMKVLIDYIIKDLKPEKPRIALVYPDNEAGKVDLASSLEKLEAYNLLPVSREVFKPGGLDASSQVMSLKRANPDYVLLCGFIPSAAPVFLRDMKKYGLSVPVFGSWATCSDVVVKIADDAARNFYSINSISYGEGSGTERMKEILLKHNPRTQNFRDITHGWIMATVVFEGLKRAGKDLSGERLVTALEGIKNLDTGGLTGSIGYSSTNHKGGNTWKVFKADPSSGKFIPITGWRKAE